MSCQNPDALPIGTIRETITKSEILTAIAANGTSTKTDRDNLCQCDESVGFICQTCYIDSLLRKMLRIIVFEENCLGDNT
jgi:hypothetical protein